MKRVMYKFITVIMVIAILAGACALGEAAELMLYRAKFELSAENQGEAANYIVEVCEDEHGCVQETIQMDMGGVQSSVFVQIGDDGSVTYSIDGGETREINAEAVLRALINAVFKSALEDMDAQDARVAAYLLDGSLQADATTLTRLIPLEVARFTGAAMNTGFMRAQDADIIAQGTLEDALNAFAAYLEALAVDFQAHAIIRSIKALTLMGLTESELSLYLPTFFMRYATEVRALAESLADKGISGDIYFQSGDAFALKVNVKDVKQDFKLNVNCSGGALNAELTSNMLGGDAHSGSTILTINADKNTETCFLYLTRNVQTKFAAFTLAASTDLSLAYVGGAFSLSLRDVAASGAITELNADYASGALEASLSTLDDSGAFALHTLYADGGGVRLHYDAGDGSNKTVFDGAVKRESDGVYTASARHEKLYSDQDAAPLENSIFDASGTLNINDNTLALAGSYVKDFISDDELNEDYVFGLNYSDLALNAYFADDDDRLDLSCAIVGEDGVYGANLIIDGSAAEWGEATYNLLSADLAIDFTKDILPVYALSADVYDVERINSETDESTYEYKHIGRLTSARTIEDGFTLEVASDDNALLSVKAQARQIPGGGAIDFEITSRGETITGDIGYDVTTSEEAGALIMNIRPYLKYGKPVDGVNVETLYEQPIIVAESPDGVITIQTRFDAGTDNFVTCKLTLEPLGEPPAHVNGRPVAAEELEGMLGKLLAAMR